MNPIPDVFSIAQVLIRTISRQALTFVKEDQVAEGTRPNGYRLSNGCDSGGIEPIQSSRTDIDNIGRGGEGGHASKKLLERLASLLKGAATAGELASWVSSMLRTAVQYRPWLPWQAFAEELRELVASSMKQFVKPACGDEKEAEAKEIAAAASMFAVCELLLAWDAAEVRSNPFCREGKSCLSICMRV